MFNFGIEYSRWDGPSESVLWFKNGLVARHYAWDGFLDVLGVWVLKTAPWEREAL